jgi:hypothetical protein
VPFQSQADFGGQVAIRVTELAAITATAELPGEVAGPAVAITIDINNGSAAPIGLDSVTVDLTDGDGNPALPMSTDPSKPFSGVVAAGEQRTAVYVFTAPVDARDDMSLTVNYSTGAPTVLFVGTLPRG